MLDSKQESFFHGMITAEFFPFETYEKDAEAIYLADKLKEQLKKAGKKYEGSYALCELMVYTKSLTFNWQAETPPEYQALEEWWNMVQQKTPLLQHFEFYAKNVHTSLVELWWKAKKQAHTIWKPSDEKSEADQSDEEKADPNSQSDSE